jgi:hypothetical protein
VESSSQDSEIFFFRNRQNDFKDFFSQENELLFCNAVCFLQWLLDTSTIQLSVVFLLTLQKFA